MSVVARLVVLVGGEGVLFLRAGRSVVGRHGEADLILPYLGVSRRHAVVEVEAATATVTDLGSRHGTRVDGQAIERASLADGGLVEFGPVACRFERLAAVYADEPTPPRDRPPDGPALTPAEHRVLLMLLSGLAEKAIAARLNVSPHTVHYHVRKIYAAHGVNARPELLARFISRPAAAAGPPGAAKTAD